MQQMRLMHQVILWFLLLITATGCGYGNEQLPKGREISSKKSPDGLSRAFVWAPETSGILGATSSQPYQVWIQYDAPQNPYALILKAEATDGVRLKWIAERQLEICYGPTDIYYFHNEFEYGEQHSQKLYKLEVLLRRVQQLADCQ
jgi:hypothetical protein